MSIEELSKEQIHIMEHSLGAKSNSPGYRNHYASREGCDTYEAILDLVDKGLMVRGRTDGTIYFHVTPAGQELIGCKEQD